MHGVVLMVTSGEISKHVPGQLVDALDDLGHVGLEVLSSQQSLQLLQLLIRNLSLPLQLAASL